MWRFLYFHFYNFPFLESLDLYGVINNDIDLPVILDLLLQEVEIESVSWTRGSKTVKEMDLNTLIFPLYLIYFYKKLKSRLSREAEAQKVRKKKF